MFNLTVMEYNCKTERLEITQGKHKVELYPETFEEILSHRVFSPFLMKIEDRLIRTRLLDLRGEIVQRKVQERIFKGAKK